MATRLARRGSRAVAPNHAAVSGGAATVGAVHATAATAAGTPTVDGGTVVARAYAAASPPTTAATDPAPLSLGTEFYVAADGTVSQIHFWQPTIGADGSTRTVGIYQVSTGTLVQATETLTVAGTGWQTKTLATPVPITAATRYKVVVFHPAGQYAATTNYYDTGAGSADHVVGALTIPNNADAAVGQGTLIYSGAIGWPSVTWNATNYWNDVSVVTPAVVAGPSVRAYSEATPPTDADTGDHAQVTAGMEFYVSANSWISQIHFWQPTTRSETTDRICGIYRVSTGTLVGTTETLPVTGVGWQTKTLLTPVPVLANTRYKVAVYHPHGSYALSWNYYNSGAGATDLVNGVLTIPSNANATTPGQGTGTWATGITYPANSDGASNFWIDLTVASTAAVSVTVNAPVATTISGPTSIGLGWTLTPSMVGLTPFGIDGASLPVYTTPPSHIVPAGTHLYRQKIVDWLDCSEGHLTFDQCFFQPVSGNVGLGSPMLTTQDRPLRGPVYIKDCEYSGTSLSTYEQAWIGFQTGCFNISRTYMHHSGSGFNTYDTREATGADILIDNNVVDNLIAYGDPNAGGNHESGFTVRDLVLTENANRKLTVRDNNIVAAGANVSGVVLIQPNDFPVNNVTISGNSFAGHGFELRLEDDESRFPGRSYHNMRAMNNRFVTPEYGAAYLGGTGEGWAQWDENYVYDGSTPTVDDIIYNGGSVTITPGAQPDCKGAVVTEPISSVLLIDPATTGGVQPVGQSGYTLKLSEEFGGAVDAVNPAGGRVKFRSDGPQWSSWYSDSLAGAGDAQHSNNPGREKEYYDIPNIGVTGGNLVLTAINDSVHSGIGLPYSSGMVASDSAHSYLYGYVEARIRCSGVGGTWPAFWLLAQDYKWPPEIDIVEQFGTDTNSRTTTFQNTGGGATGSLNLTASGANTVSAFHTFGMKWTSTEMRFFVDGTQYAIETNTACIPQKPMYVVLNLAVDGNQTINSGAFPTTFLVDYVRVWQ